MMASFRLEDIAHEAVSLSLALMVSEMEAPEGRHLPWVGQHGGQHAPYQHYVDEHEHYDDSLG